MQLLGVLLGGRGRCSGLLLHVRAIPRSGLGHLPIGSLEDFLLWRYQTAAPAPPAVSTPRPAAAAAAAVPAATTSAPPTTTFGRCRRAWRRAYTVAVAVETISSASSICRSIHFDLKMLLDLSMPRAYIAGTEARPTASEIPAFSECFLAPARQPRALNDKQQSQRPELSLRSSASPSASARAWSISM